MRRLTPTEQKLFDRLMASIGKIVTKKELQIALWGESMESSRSEQVYIGYLRRKIRGHYTIYTVWGLGYSIKKICDHDHSESKHENI